MSENPPRIQVAEQDVLSFEKPEGFDDLTDYLFQAADGGSRLTVQQGDPEAGKPSDLETIAAAYLTQLHRLFAPGDLVFIGVGPFLDAPFPSQGIDFTFIDRLRSWRERSLFRHLPNGSKLHLAYVTPEEDVGATDRFATIVRSLRPFESETGEPPAGFTWRHVRGINLAVPVSLFAPICYQFVTPNGRVRVHLKVAPSSTPARNVPPTPPGARVEEAGTYAGMKMYSVVRPGSAGAVKHYACCEEKLYSEGRKATVTGQAADDPASTRLMQQAVLTLLQSIQPRT